jgi:hypothetical protein
MEKEILYALIESANLSDRNGQYHGADNIDAALRIAWIGDDTSPEEEFSTDPSQINAQPVSMEVTPDVAQKAEKFAKTGKPLFYTGRDGKKYLIIHGTPEGMFNTGDPSVNADDSNPRNDGFVTPDGLIGWLQSKGYANGSVNVIACYGGRLEPINFSGGTMKSYFRNRGPIGFGIQQGPQNARFIFTRR